MRAGKRALRQPRAESPLGGFKSLLMQALLPRPIGGTMKKYINVDGNTAASNIAYYLSEAIEVSLS